MDKPALINKIKSLDGLSNDEKADLIHLLNETKQYGLVWEDKPEAVEEQLRTQLPVLIEVPERRILAEKLKDQAAAVTSSKATPTPSPDLFSTTEHQTPNPEHLPPNHILIEGDNLHALTALTFTHEGRIDVIYIDPPYNTGNKDFKYNDCFVDKEDSYRHSKWLSFMHKRLQIAKKLLSEKGVIFISIDDNEQAQLKMLCDEVFVESNYIATNVWEKIHSTKNDAKYLSVNHEYILFYSKRIESISINLLPRTEDMDSRYKNPDNDERGPWQSGDLVANELRKDGNYEVISPKTRKSFFVPSGKHWVYSYDNMMNLIKENRIWFGKDGNSFPRKKRFLNEVKDGKKGSTLWNSHEVGHNQEGKRELIDFFGQSDSLFSTPKPLRLLGRVLNLATSQNSTILDFFAGSGTTLHATMALNAEDGGNRQCIMVTNNENNICEEVTYERNKRVIQGYTNSKGNWVDGLPNNNFRYYKTAFVNREKTTKNKKQLTLLATELLCIKEDIYTELFSIKDFKFEQKTVRCFSDKGKYLMVIYDEEIIEQLVPVIAEINSKTKIKIYVFAPGQYPFTEEFEDVLHKIELGALPDAIYKAYMSILPKKSDRSFSEQPTPETDITETSEDAESDLFTENIMEP